MGAITSYVDKCCFLAAAVPQPFIARGRYVD